MIRICCHDQHGTHNEIYHECSEILDYANVRLDKSHFQENKTTCANCKIHCYKLVMRVRIHAVMRYAGLRMFYHHPVLALFHFIYGYRKKPIRLNHIIKNQ